MSAQARQEMRPSPAIVESHLLPSNVRADWLESITSKLSSRSGA
jgi:hypothetical protein